MSISARRSLWNVQIVVARSLLKRRYSVWQCGGTPVFVRGNISIVSLLTLFPWAQISRDACEKDKKKKQRKEKRWGVGGTQHSRIRLTFFDSRLSPFDMAALFILPPPCYDPRYFDPNIKTSCHFVFVINMGAAGQSG